MADVEMPQLGETVTEGTITQWFKAIGDEVAEDEMLFEVSTDKVDSEVPSPVAGYLAEIRAPEGETVEVGDVIAVISDSPPDGSGGSAEPSAEAEPEPEPEPEPEAEAEVAPEPQPESEPEAAEPQAAPDSSGDGSGEAQDVTMPQLGETVTEGTITQWFKAVGDEVAEDEMLFEVSTDKVDSEVPSPVSGFLAEIRAPEGETVEVGDVIAVVTSGQPSGGGSAPAADSDPEPAASNDEPAPKKAAPEKAASSKPSSKPPAPAAAPAAPAPSDLEGVVLSPVVRKLINTYGIDPSTISGTGKGGRISRDDVQKIIESRGLSSQASSGAAPAAAPSAPSSNAGASSSGSDAAAARSASSAPVAGRGETEVPLSRIRKATAKHMVLSKLQTAPHVLSTMEVDYENIEKVRRRVKAQFKAEEGFSLTYLPFIARALVDAIREFPHLNAELREDSILVKHYVNLGIAVDLDYEGLMVPVIKGADGLRLRAIARSISDLAQRARTKDLGPDDISGGTFTISSAGGFGSHITFPVISQPQSAILSTDGVSRKPVVVTDADGNESIAIHSVGLLAMAWDHRVFDGAYATKFLAKIKEIMETRDWAAEL